MLTSITIKDNYTSSLRNISFNYRNVQDERLRLDDITIDGEYKYAFEYNNWGLLPSFTSKSYDHFGYYNGKIYNDYPISVGAGYSSNRDTDIEKVKYGSLTKITYPTGGYTTFEYEPHRYSSYVSNDRTNLVSETGIVGGLRIKKITDFDGTNKIIKNYLYQNSMDNTIPSGILMLKNVYYIQNYPANTTCGSKFYTTSFNINSIVPLSNFMGTTIEYPVVIEKQTTEQGNNIGYTTYNYTSYLDYKDTFAGTVQPAYSIFDPKTDISFKRGLIKSKIIKDASDNLVLSEEYTYSGSDLKKSRGFGYDWIITGLAGSSSGAVTPDGNPGMRGNAYEIY
jgi:hypothetical protein